ncbi:hypothetical protein K435DRAFT_778849 [Dendrothele bispora CBS 962.96]|uniref:Uncharacterized protein n=1 Tax=Dendrothele bispora (strain CBS 962.96) TaxID=1314807 RepID=A0A4S8M1L3_DENBC|nr:hypothetical protein K435DRAFT_778849 [Dendrothele bispora CBS 962.96]
MATFFPQASQLLPAFSQAPTIARDQVTHNDQVHTGDSDSIVSPGVLGTQSIFDDYETVRRRGIRLLREIYKEVIDENDYPRVHHLRAQKRLKSTRYHWLVIDRNPPPSVAVVTYGREDAQAARERDLFRYSVHLSFRADSESSSPGLVFHNERLTREMLLKALFRMFHQRHDDSRRDTEQHSRRNSNDHDIWPGDENPDSRDIADSPPSSSADTESPSGSSRSVGTVSGGYTKQDNRRIDRNIETGTYREGDDYTVNNGDWKTVVATGGVATTAFSAGHTIGAHRSYNHDAQLQLPTNNAITTIYPQYSFDEVPPLVMKYVILPVVLMKMFELVRQSTFTG